MSGTICATCSTLQGGHELCAVSCELLVHLQQCITIVAKGGVAILLFHQLMGGEVEVKRTVLHLFFEAFHVAVGTVQQYTLSFFGSLLLLRCRRGQRRDCTTHR